MELVDVVALGVKLKGGLDLLLLAFALPLICQQLQRQPVEQAVKGIPCLSGLKLAYFCTEGESLSADTL